MNCPKCNGKSKVYNSRPSGNTTRRFRICLKCQHYYKTQEVSEDTLQLINSVIQLAHKVQPVAEAPHEKQKPAAAKQSSWHAETLKKAKGHHRNLASDRILDDMDDDDDINLRDLGL